MYALVVLTMLVAILAVVAATMHTRLRQVEKRMAAVESRGERHSNLLREEIVPRLKDLEPVRLRALKEPSGARVH